MTDTHCPIWGTPAEELPSGRDGREIDSPRAGGRYFISGTALAKLNRLEDGDKVLLTDWLIEKRQFGDPCPVISSDYSNFFLNRAKYTVHQRIDMLLWFIFEKTDLIGTVYKFKYNDPLDNDRNLLEILAFTSSIVISEVKTLAEYSMESGYIEYRHTTDDRLPYVSTFEIMLRPRGYTRITELVSPNILSDRAFVAMWFGESMEDAYESGIKPAIEAAGYKPVRIDRIEHVNRIDDEMISEIRRSRFLVADFTQGDDGARGGVYYEAGFAAGLNITVIFLCREDCLAKVHFDTRQFNHIVWKTPEDLRGKLEKRITAVIGDGPLR